MRLIAVLAVIALMPGTADTMVTPQAGRGDPHIRSLVYDPDEVFQLKVALGFAATVEMSPDERIENVVVGNSATWQVTANKRADHLFIKPMLGAGETNLEVITDARRYSFLLSPLAGQDDSAAFVVRFLYTPSSPVGEAGSVVVDSTYRMAGSRNLWPISITDDGSTTSIAWSPQASLPAVFADDLHGHQSLVTSRMVAGTMVIEGVAPRYVFRLGQEEAAATRKAGRSKP